MPVAVGAVDRREPGSVDAGFDEAEGGVGGSAGWDGGTGSVGLCGGAGMPGIAEVGDAVELMAAGGVKRRQKQLPAFGRQIEIVDQYSDHELVVFVVTGGRSDIQVIDPVGIAEIEQEGGPDGTVWGEGG